MSIPSVAELLDICDWRRRVATLYAEARRGGGDPEAWRSWRRSRDRLVAGHPQSPLEAGDPARRRGLSYFPHDPGWRRLAAIEPLDPGPVDLPDGDGTQRFLRVATAHIVAGGRRHHLDVFWLDAYGGGLFIPFADATTGSSTYGGGRYLIDTVKGADLGVEAGRLVLDFNFAYQPSCSYSPRWVCPLAPASNRLDLAVEAGERLALG